MTSTPPGVKVLSSLFLFCASVIIGVGVVVIVGGVVVIFLVAGVVVVRGVAIGA